MARLVALMAVLLLGAASAPSPAPLARPSQEPLRTIVRVRAVTTFCKTFQTLFNGAVAPLLDDDAQIGFVDYTFGEIEPHYRALAPELLLYDDRVKLMQYLKTLFASIPVAQGEINALRATAATADDAKTAKMTLDLASRLQRVLDDQRTLGADSLGVVHAMVDVATGTNLTSVPPQIDQPRPVATGIAPALGGDDLTVQSMPEAKRDVRTILSFQKQRDRIGDAESDAARTADTLESNC